MVEQWKGGSVCTYLFPAIKMLIVKAEPIEGQNISASRTCQYGDMSYGERRGVV